jgi:hypothetical protein
LFSGGKADYKRDLRVTFGEYCECFPSSTDNSIEVVDDPQGAPAVEDLDTQHAQYSQRVEEKELYMSEAKDDLLAKSCWLPHYERLPFIFGIAITAPS